MNPQLAALIQELFGRQAGGQSLAPQRQPNFLPSAPQSAPPVGPLAQPAQPQMPSSPNDIMALASLLTGGRQQPQGGGGDGGAPGAPPSPLPILSAPQGAIPPNVSGLASMGTQWPKIPEPSTFDKMSPYLMALAGGAANWQDPGRAVGGALTGYMTGRENLRGMTDPYQQALFDHQLRTQLVHQTAGLDIYADEAKEARALQAENVRQAQSYEQMRYALRDHRNGEKMARTFAMDPKYGWHFAQFMLDKPEETLTDLDYQQAVADLENTRANTAMTEQARLDLLLRNKDLSAGERGALSDALSEAHKRYNAYLKPFYRTDAFGQIALSDPANQPMPHVEWGRVPENEAYLRELERNRQITPGIVVREWQTGATAPRPPANIDMDAVNAAVAAEGHTGWRADMPAATVPTAAQGSAPAPAYTAKPAPAVVSTVKESDALRADGYTGPIFVAPDLWAELTASTSAEELNRTYGIFRAAAP